MEQQKVSEIEDQRQILGVLRGVIETMKQEHEFFVALWKSHYALVSALRVEYGLESLPEPPAQPDAEALARVEAGRLELERMFGDGEEPSDGGER